MAKINRANEFGERLRDIRELRGLTQSELGKIANISSTQIAHFESGSRKPSLDNLTKLVVALEVSSDYLIGIVDDRQLQKSMDSLTQKLHGMTKRKRDLAEDILEVLIKH